MRILTLVLVTAAATLAPAAPALAKPPKPVCNLVVDPVHDVQPDAASLDILSADLATGSTTVVGVVRLRSLTTGDALSTTGARWDLGFAVGGAQYAFQLRRDVQGGYLATFLRNGTAQPVATTFVVTATEIRWVVPRSAVSEIGPAPSGTPMSGLAAQTYTTPIDHAADKTTFAGADYPDGYPSCVMAA